MKLKNILSAGAEDLLKYQSAGVKLQNAGAGLFKHSGAQAILPDGTLSPIFRDDSNDVEKRQLLAWLNSNAKDLIITENKDEETGVKDLTQELKDLESGDVTSSKSEDKDISLKTVDPSKPIGTTSVTPQTIIIEPSEAVRKQEEVASEQLRLSRLEKARQKRSLLKRRLEGMAEFGSGKKVLTGRERGLSITKGDVAVSEATGKRGGRSRGSLMTGSRGGIGFYSRY